MVSVSFVVVDDVFRLCVMVGRFGRYMLIDSGLMVVSVLSSRS